MYHKIKKHLDQINRMLEKHKDKLSEVHDDDETSPEDERADEERNRFYQDDMGESEENYSDFKMGDEHEDEDQDRELIEEMISKQKNKLKNKKKGMFA